MPKIANLWVSDANALNQLDDHINGHSNLGAFAAELSTSSTPGFDTGGPFGDDEATQAHWTTDWIDAHGHGGAYWPYANAVELATMLKEGLLQSVQLTMETGKLHNSLWVLNGEAPSRQAQEQLSAEAQNDLFKVAVHEGTRVVNLVIMTPRPV